MWDRSLRGRYAIIINSGQSTAGGWPDTRPGGPCVRVDPDLHTLAFNIVTTREKLERHREALTRMLRALVAAEAEIAADPKALQAETEKWLGLDAGDLARKTYRLLKEGPPVVSKWQLNPHYRVGERHTACLFAGSPHGL